MTALRQAFVTQRYCGNFKIKVYLKDDDMDRYFHFASITLDCFEHRINVLIQMYQQTPYLQEYNGYKITHFWRNSQKMKFKIIDT